jgi:hypothetical protein
MSAGGEDRDVPGEGVYWVTPCIAQGAFPEEHRAGSLLAAGITHVLNLSLRPSQLSTAQGFRAVLERPVEEFYRLPDKYVLGVLGDLHGILEGTDHRVYVHCVAGQNRSPAIVWLYLIACGLSPGIAKEMVELRAPHAVAGHPSLVDESLVRLVRGHGAEHFLPIKRPRIIEQI